MEKKFKLSEEPIFLGVAGGTAEYLGIDANLFRIGFFLLTLLSVGIPLLVYFGIYLWLKTQENDDDIYFSNNEAGINIEWKTKQEDNEKDK